MARDVSSERRPATGTDPLARVRVRLTAWYVGTFSAILVLLGGGLLLVLQRQFTEQLDGSLRESLSPIVRYAQSQPSDAELRAAVNAGAIDALHSRHRDVFIFTADGVPIGTAVPAPWIQSAAVVAARAGVAATELDAPGDHTLRLHAERFTLANGTPYVAVMLVDRDRIDDRFEALIAAFGGALAVAVILIAIGGYVLVRKSLEPVEATLRSMRRFMADAAHELQTPITVIRSRAEVAVQQAREPAVYVEALNGIAQEAERVGNIVGDLLTLARADAGERAIEHVPFYLDDVVVDATSSARVLAEGQDVTIFAERFEEAPVVGDPTLVRQLVVILLHNAVKFAAAGGTIRLSVGVTSGHPTLVVEDDGIGINADHLPKVFERFYRANETLARNDDRRAKTGAGAGLGLSIARWIADAHDATITIASTVNVGTRVTVQFPAGRG